MDNNIISLDEYLKNRGTLKASEEKLDGVLDRLNVFKLLKYLNDYEFRKIIYNATLFYSDLYPNANAEIFCKKGRRSSEYPNQRIDKIMDDPDYIELFERIEDTPGLAELFLRQLHAFEDNKRATR